MWQKNNTDQSLSSLVNKIINLIELSRNCMGPVNCADKELSWRCIVFSCAPPRIIRMVSNDASRVLQLTQSWFSTKRNSCEHSCNIQTFQRNIVTDCVSAKLVGFHYTLRRRRHLAVLRNRLALRHEPVANASSVAVKMLNGAVLTCATASRHR